jgi:hypothetical protein
MTSFNLSFRSFVLIIVAVYSPLNFDDQAVLPFLVGHAVLARPRKLWQSGHVRKLPSAAYASSTAIAHFPHGNIAGTCILEADWRITCCRECTNWQALTLLLLCSDNLHKLTPIGQTWALLHSLAGYKGSYGM